MESLLENSVTFATAASHLHQFFNGNAMNRKVLQSSVFSSLVCTVFAKTAKVTKSLYFWF